MKSTNSVTINMKEVITTVLDIEAKAILDLKESIDESVNQAINIILQCRGRVVVTGIGKSGIIGRKINATLASTGTPSLFLHPAEGLHGDLGMVMKDDVVLAISNSGESDELIKLIPSINKIGARIISIVSNPNSTLARNAEVTLCIGKITEACPLGLAPTTSTTVTLALGDALAIALQKARGFTANDFAVFHPNGSLGRKLLMTVEDIVLSTRKNPYTSGNVSVKDAIFLMTGHGLGAISVVNELKQIVGIMTDGDIRRALALSEDVLKQPITQLCNTKPIVANKDMLASEALLLMEERKVNVLPIVDEEKRPVGMVHIHDLMNLGV